MDDLLAAEAEIVAQLQAALPENVRVLTATDEAITRASGQLLPAVFVMFGGDTVAAIDAGSKRRVRLDQTWNISLAVTSVNDRLAKDARNQAGPLLAAINDTLCGFQPLPDWGQMERQPMPAPEFTDSALIYTTPFLSRVNMILDRG